MAFADNAAIRRFLDNRGLDTSDVDYLQHPDVLHTHDPTLLSGVDDWIAALHDYGKHQSPGTCRIAIIPDYDADGILSGTLARVALHLFGFGDAYIHPPKTADGYGMSRKSVDAVLAVRPDTDLIITTDNGSNAHVGIHYAKALGVRVLVTDHHLADGDSPADAVVNPNHQMGGRDERYPYKDISGTTVIYKTMLAYAMRHAPHTLPAFHSTILLVGVSVVSDVMPMLDENRYYVTESVAMLERFIDGHTHERMLNHDDSPLGAYYRGVGMLVDVLERHGKLKYGIDADTFGFTIGPMLNSPRRMTGDSAVGFELFQTTRMDIPLLGYQDALPGDVLYQMNESRKAYIKTLRGALLNHMAASGKSPFEHVVFTARMSGGVAGLLSGAFTRQYGLPSIAFAAPSSDDTGIGPVIDVDVSDRQMVSGSARAPEGFDLHGYLSEIDATQPGLIHKWGGHAQAAGITVRGANYEAFKAAFVSGLQSFAGSADGVGVLPITGEYIIGTPEYDDLASRDASMIPDEPYVFNIGVAPVYGSGARHELSEVVPFFESLRPFGQGFREPVYSVVFSSDAVKRFYMGADKQHVKLTLPNKLSIIDWHGAEDYRRGSGGMYIANGRLSINVFNGRESLQLIADSLYDLGADV